MATTWIRALHVNKGQSIARTLKDRTDYADNPEKTAKGEFVSSYECHPLSVDAEFLFSKKQYEQRTSYRRDWGANDVIAYHIRQAFRPGEVTPQEANAIGYELAMRFTKGQHAFIVATHIDRAHLHNHVVFNSTRLDCTQKFKNPYNSSFILQRISDILCLEHGLSIIESPQPSRGRTYGTWLGDEKKPSYQNLLRQKIDEIIPACKTFDDFIAAMQSAGYEVNSRKQHITIKVPGAKRPSRLDTLRGDYTEEAIRERIAGTRTVGGGVFRSQSTTPEPARISLLIDIQAKLQSGKGEAYAQWAKVFNLKEAAKTLMFLQDHHLTEYADLEKAASDATSEYSEISKQMKSVDQRLAAINELQKQIGTYGKTRETYAAYRKSGYSKKFKAEHESEIILHQAAKRFFDEQGLEKLPSIKKLQAEYSELAAEKRKLYQRYQAAKAKMRELLTAKNNVDRILANRKNRRPATTCGKANVGLHVFSARMGAWQMPTAA
jgi:hypothetical protein